MDRVIKSVAMVCLVLAVSLVSFHARQRAAAPTARPLAMTSFTYSAVGTSLPERLEAADEVRITPSPKSHRAPAISVIRPAFTGPRPAAKPRPKPPAPRVSLPPSTNSIDNLIKSVFAPLGSSAVAWALRVADCESGDNPGARSPGGTFMGLFQFSRPTWNGTPYASGNPYDAATNAKAARWLYSRSGPGPWGCR